MGRETERRIATQRLLNSPVMEDLALKIGLLEAAMTVLTEAVEQRDRALARQQTKLLEAYDLIMQRARERDA